MAKKDQKAALNMMLGNTAEQPLKQDGRRRKRKNMNPANSQAGYETACILVNSGMYAKIKEIACIENTTIKAVLETAMTAAVKRYEDKFGEIKIRKTRNIDLDELFSL